MATFLHDVQQQQTAYKAVLSYIVPSKSSLPKLQCIERISIETNTHTLRINRSVRKKGMNDHMYARVLVRFVNSA